MTFFRLIVLELIGDYNNIFQKKKKMPKRVCEKGEISLFIDKLWNILQNPEFSHMILWNNCGKTFTILNAPLLEAQILPVYFRHSKLKSFVRQLNMYGFKKTQRDKYSIVFYHNNFTMGDPQKLSLIRRKLNKRTKCQSLQQNADSCFFDKKYSNEIQPNQSASKSANQKNMSRTLNPSSNIQLQIQSYGRLKENNDNLIPFISPSSYLSIQSQHHAQPSQNKLEGRLNHIQMGEEDGVDFWQVAFTSCQYFI